MSSVNSPAVDAFTRFEFLLTSFAGSLPHAWKPFCYHIVSDLRPDGSTFGTVEMMEGHEHRRLLRLEAARLQAMLADLTPQYDRESVRHLGAALSEAADCLRRVSADTAARRAAEVADNIRELVSRMARLPRETEPYGPEEERDGWLYSRWQAGETWATITAEFQRVWMARGWRKVGQSGVIAGVKRYAAHHKLPLREGKGGRPTARK